VGIDRHTAIAIESSPAMPLTWMPFTGARERSNAPSVDPFKLTVQDVVAMAREMSSLLEVPSMVSKPAPSSVEVSKRRGSRASNPIKVREATLSWFYATKYDERP